MNTDCERAREVLMAALDDESGFDRALGRDHLSTCAECEAWWANLQSMSAQLHELPYPPARVDVWTVVEHRIRGSDNGSVRQFWPLAAAIVGWRAIQLFVDLPMPVLHPIVPLAATVAAVWMVAGDPLAIETSAPELKKRGI